MYEGKINTNSKFISLVNKLGYALITNERHEMYCGRHSGLKDKKKKMDKKQLKTRKAKNEVCNKSQKKKYRSLLLVCIVSL